MITDIEHLRQYDRVVEEYTVVRKCLTEEGVLSAASPLFLYERVEGGYELRIQRLHTSRAPRSRESLEAYTKLLHSALKLINFYAEGPFPLELHGHTLIREMWVWIIRAQ